MQTGAQIKTGAIGGAAGETAQFLPTAASRSSADLEIPGAVSPWSARVSAEAKASALRRIEYRKAL
jgi:hypothetical protein